MNLPSRYFLRISAAILYFASASPSLADTITAYTSFLPPLSLNESDKGIAVEMMEAVAERAAIDLRIEFVPWKRAQTIVQNTPGTLIFSIGRSEDREQDYTWIASLVETESGFITTGKPIDSFRQAVEEMPIVGVLLGSGRVRVLRDNDVTTLDEIAEEDQFLTMLSTGRIDAWYTMLWRGAYFLKKQGYDRDAFVFGKPVYVGRQYLAAHKEFDPDLARHIADTIAAYRKTPAYRALINRYVR
ncbi:substrate-binding periplasmic protein [Roseibium sp. M-1]